MGDALSIFPVGTPEELLAIGMNPAEVPSCAERVGDERVGCSYYKTCRFRQYRDQVGDKMGPENFGYTKVLAVDTLEEVANGLIQPCYQIMQTEHQMMRQADEIGRLYSDFVPPGGKVRRKWSERAHPKKDPNCQACQKNECHKMVEMIEEVEVLPFVRPAARFGRARAFIESIKQESRDSIDFERRVGAITKRVVDPRIHEKKDRPDKGKALGEQLGTNP